MKDSSKTFYNLFREFQTKEPIMGYFCGLYAAKLAIEQKNNEFIKPLMNDLEKMKQSVIGHPALSSDSKSFAYVLQFASRIFLSADDEDRSGLATTSTAQAFVTSSNLFMVLGLFKENLPSELSDRINYGRAKAAEIIKRQKEGSDVTPKAKSKNKEAPPSDNIPLDPTKNKIEKSSTEPIVKGPKLATAPSPSVSSSSANSSSSSTLPSYSGTFNPLSPNIATPIINMPALHRAEKYARQAVSALQFEDISTAKDQLEKALRELENMK